MPLKDDINSLVLPGTKNSSLTEANNRDPISAQVNRSRLQQSEGGTGLQSPITEESRQTQSRLLSDSTGTIFISVDHVTQIVFVDANGTMETRNYNP